MTENSKHKVMESNDVFNLSVADESEFVGVLFTHLYYKQSFSRIQIKEGDRN